MKIDTVTVQNFRCFGPRPTKVPFEPTVTAFVGGNGSGKTAVLQALSRLFGVTSGVRAVRRQDFHLPHNEAILEPGASLSIEAVFSFPELEDVEPTEEQSAVPEFFLQMAASSPGEPLKARMALRATWNDDGTPDGSVDEDLRWITSLDDHFVWDECTRVQAVERASIQLIYVPAARDAATQVSALLRGRLWKAARWSDDFRQEAAASAGEVHDRFAREGPTAALIDRLAKRWRQVHEADTDTSVVLRLIDTQFDHLVARAEFSFLPDESGRERGLSELSDGQRSLFHIALTATTLEIERDAFTPPLEENSFDAQKLRQVFLTILGIEEPENSLAPFFLSRIIEQAREIGSLQSAQVLLSSHSPAILSRIEPEEVRYFRLNRTTRRSLVRTIKLPKDDQEARRYVRLAVKAHPELYFARFVLLGEGDSERLVIPRIADAMGLALDPSFVAVVPLGGRYVNHFWKLLNRLKIPHASLIDLDLGRAHGGAGTIRHVVEELAAVGNDLANNAYVQSGELDLDELPNLSSADLAEDIDENIWLKALAEEGVFLSAPLDFDFSMLMAFPGEYQHPNPGGGGPRTNDNAITRAKATTLKTGGDSDLYDESYDEYFAWYPYLFLRRSKPEAHMAALSKIDARSLATGAPSVVKAFVAYAKKVLSL